MININLIDWIKQDMEGKFNLEYLEEKNNFSYIDSNSIYYLFFVSSDSYITIKDDFINFDIKEFDGIKKFYFKIECNEVNENNAYIKIIRAKKL